MSQHVDDRLVIWNFVFVLFDPITSTFWEDLHWLPVESGIRFKQSLLVYKSLHGTAPLYIAEMCTRLSFDSEHYQLRSAVHGELVVPLAKKVTLGRHSYRYASPSLWNVLAQDIRDASFSLSQFQSKLKTFLYREVRLQNSLTAEAPSWWLCHKTAFYKFHY